MKSYQVNNFESEIICKEITTPSDPGSGYRKIYPKSDGWYDQRKNLVHLVRTHLKY